MFSPALSHNFGIDLCAFFCLALVPVVCKTFGFSPSVDSQLEEKKSKLTVCHVGQSWHTMWHTKRPKKNQLFILFIIF